MVLVFLFKQKTAYEMRISDWSSDVCSSDLQSAVKSVDDRDNSIVAAHCTSAHRAHSDDPLIADHPLQRVEAAKIVVSVCSLDHGHQSIANADVVCKHLAGDRKSGV